MLDTCIVAGKARRQRDDMQMCGLKKNRTGMQNHETSQLVQGVRTNVIELHDINGILND